MPFQTKFLPYFYYLISILVLSFYSVQRFSGDAEMELSFTHVFTLYTVAFASIALIRVLTEGLFIAKADLLDRPRRQFFYDIALYILAGTGVLAHEIVFSNHHALTIAIIVLYLATIGFFASIDNVLTRERYWMTINRHYNVANLKILPLASKHSLVMTITIFLATSVIAISALETIEILSNKGEFVAEKSKRIFIIDVMFIFSIMIMMLLRMIHAYSQNLHQIFADFLAILKNVQEGKLDDYVPVMRRDEFGLIAQRTNRIIDGLREKQRLQQTLEKIVSPSIMDKLMSTDDKTLKQGQEYEVAILFCDLREFTSFTETSNPEDVIFFLNSLFSQMASIVSEHNGIINKFMGDAILAVFGLDENQRPVEDAVSAAWNVIDSTQQIVAPNGENLEIGIGIHSGSVVAGTIGSEERFEYTFIGDPVNTASRLDGLTKRLEYKIVISSNTYDQLTKETRMRFDDLGYHQLRGKKNSVHVYGARKITMMPKAVKESVVR